MDIMIDCPRCGQNKLARDAKSHMCIDCEKAENSRLTYFRQHQEDWIAAAKEQGINLWELQPNETQWEYTVWTAFRDSYPGKKPTLADVAKQLNTTYNVVNKISQRWTFNLRMQAWMKYVDEITLAQRRSEILDMNKDHISMAQRLRDKMSRAIDSIVPDVLTPSEIVAMTKLAADLERKAHIDTIAQEEMQRTAAQENDNPSLKKHVTSTNDLAEILGILQKTGAFTLTQTTEVKVAPECREIEGDEA